MKATTKHGGLDESVRGVEWVVVVLSCVQRYGYGGKGEVQRERQVHKPITGAFFLLRSSSIVDVGSLAHVALVGGLAGRRENGVAVDRDT